MAVLGIIIDSGSYPRTRYALTAWPRCGDVEKAEKKDKTIT
jgi:hypothetical protein